MLRRLVLAPVLALVLTLGALFSAGAALASPTDELTVLAGWTQPTAASTAAWTAARLDRASWASYHFDWSTDYCTSSPDNPLGFDFKNACAHHDFGYRNYKAVGRFPANKARVDSTFYADLKRECATYKSAARPACDSLAWTYYEAVHVFGSLAKVDPDDIDTAARIEAKAAS